LKGINNMGTIICIGVAFGLGIASGSILTGANTEEAKVGVCFGFMIAGAAFLVQLGAWLK